MLKVCSKCKIEKSIKDFYKDKRTKCGLCSQCKSCHNNYAKNEKTRAYKKIYSKTDKAIFSRKKYHSSIKGKNKKKEWLKTERGQIRKYRHLQKDYKEKRKIWIENNREKTKKYFSDYIKNRRRNDKQFNLAILLRERLRGALKNNKKIGSAVKDLGCTLGELKIYLEKKFTDGMSWENQGEWEIDHIYPLSRLDLTNREDFLKGCNYKNLQPLWKIDNIKKGNKIL